MILFLFSDPDVPFKKASHIQAHKRVINIQKTCVTLISKAGKVMATINEYLKFEEHVKTFSQDQLIEKTRSLFQKEKSIEDALIVVLTEIYRRRVYAAMGYSSLFELLTQYFYLSAAAAYQKIAAIKFINQVPEAKEKLLTGATNVSQLAILNSHIQKKKFINIVTKLDPLISKNSTKFSQD